MSQNRDAPAYQEYAATILAQLPASVVARLQATDAQRVRSRPARGDAVRAQNSLVISAPCSFNSGGQQCGGLLVDDEHFLFLGSVLIDCKVVPT